MANNLIKKQGLTRTEDTVVVPGTPGTPGSPAVTVYVQTEVCTMRYAAPGSFRGVYDRLTGQTTYQFVPNPPISGASVKAYYACSVESVAVQYPAVPEVPATPPTYQVRERYIPGWNLGWNAGARSKAFVVGDGLATFRVRSTSIGVIIGLKTQFGDGLYTGRDIDYGFYCHSGLAHVMQFGQQGADTWAFTRDTQFAIRRTGSEVFWYMDGILVYSRTGASTASFWLEAAMYSAVDEVMDPTLQQGDPELRPPGTMGLDLTLPSLRVLLSPEGYAELDLTLPSLRADLGFAMPAPAFTILDLQLPALIAGFTATRRPNVMSLDLALPSLRALYAPFGYAELDLAMRPPAPELGELEGPEFGSLSMLMQLDALLDTEIEVGEPGLDITLPSLRLELGVPADAAELFSSLSLSVTVEEAIPVDTADLNSELNLSVEFEEELADAAQLFSALQLNITFGAVSGETASLTNTLSLAATLTASGNSTADFFTDLRLRYALSFPGTDTSVPPPVVGAPRPPPVRPPVAGPNVGVDAGFEAWAVNMDNAASTVYDNYPFESMANIGGSYFGAGLAGIQLLDGDTDNGTPIRAVVHPGRLDFSTNQLKTVKHVYVGVSSALPMLLQIEAQGAVYTYTARDASAHMQQERFTLGKGLRTSYVTLKLFNQAGADFEVDSLAFAFAELSRRIR